MNWILEVVKGEETAVTKTYPTACQCCDAVLKAKAYYESLKESVTLKMKSEFGHLCAEINVNTP